MHVVLSSLFDRSQEMSPCGSLPASTMVARSSQVRVSEPLYATSRARMSRNLLEYICIPGTRPLADPRHGALVPSRGVTLCCTGIVCHLEAVAFRYIVGPASQIFEQGLVVFREQGSRQAD